MSGGLRVLSAERALRSGFGAASPARSGACNGGGARGKSAGSDAVLHGSGVAAGAGGERVRKSSGDGARSFVAGTGSVLHAGNVEGRASGATERGGTFGVQPQSGYVAGILWVDHHDASV